PHAQDALVPAFATLRVECTRPVDHPHGPRRYPGWHHDVDGSALDRARRLDVNPAAIQRHGDLTPRSLPVVDPRRGPPVEPRVADLGNQGAERFRYVRLAVQ